VRYSLKPEFVDGLGKLEFFAYRKKGIEPSAIPKNVADEVIKWVSDQTDDYIFKIEPRPDFKFTPAKGSFNKVKCSVCGEYVFERYVRMKDGQIVCIPDSGYKENR
jgi:formylmethanofuran dehydrogenase subunit E